MLPKVKETVEVTLKSYSFKFRRLTWRDTFSSKKTSKVEVLAQALISVADTPTDYEGALKILRSLPIPIQDRVYVIYIGSQDERRLLTSLPPWSAPEAIEYKETLDKEEAQLDSMISESEEAFANQYGRQALDEERELSREIIKNSGYKGAILKEKSEFEDDGWYDE